MPTAGSEILRSWLFLFDYFVDMNNAQIQRKEEQKQCGLPLFKAFAKRAAAWFSMRYKGDWGISLNKQSADLGTRRHCLLLLVFKKNKSVDNNYIGNICTLFFGIK